MDGDREKTSSREATWLVPVSALCFGVAVFLLLAGVYGFFLHEVGWRWLLALRMVWICGVYGFLVASIRFFKNDSDAVTVHSVLGLRRKCVRLDDVGEVCGRWDADLFPVVYVRRHDGKAVKLNWGRRKLCERLAEQLRMRLRSGEQTSTPRRTFPAVCDPLQAAVAEWLLDYGAGLVLLAWHGWMLYVLLREKGVV